ncbi:ATP-binding cassette domain-containing protein [Frigidibacter albus]
MGAAAPRLAGPASLALLGCLTPAGVALPDIRIAAGERVALVGASGAGKTSALRLMAGLELPSAGQVIVAGQALTADNADAWRARLGWMPQAPHFLAGSLRQNLTLGRAGDLGAALDTAAVGQVVSAMPQGLATRLGETGGGLSGGEARRITLARAVYGAPDLILADEPTADLDAATARIVTAGLLAEAARGATLIVATHDRQLAARMDRVIELGGAQ